MLAYNFDEQLQDNLSGSATECIPPQSLPYFLCKRLKFDQALTSSSMLAQRR